MKKEILVAISVAGVLFGLSVSLAAQEKLSLAQCREMALKYNKDMAAANKQTEAARLMSLSYKANFFPNFTANGTGIYSTADGSLGVPGGNLPVFLPNPATGELVSSGFAYFPGLNLDYKVGTVYSGGIQVEQPLYMGGKIRAAYKMSLLGKEMAHLNEALTTSEVILNTDKAYVQLVKAKEMRKVAEKYHNLLTELFKNVKSAHRHGMKPQNDVLKVQVKLNESELSLRKADNALRLAGMNLCHYIGRPLTAQIDISDDFPEVEQEWKVQVSDITARPEYGILNKQIAIAEQEVKLNRSELLPRVGVRGSYDYLHGLEKMIVDLRDNPGGLLNSVCDILRKILPEGLIVYTEDKDGNREEEKCDGKNELRIPLAVLVNESSASASEIFAGAVQDYGIGTIVGTTTYGKGVVQSIRQLSDGSAIKLTIANYYTPKGNNINKTGIKPDIEVSLDTSLLNKNKDEITHEEDNQLQEAIKAVEKEK